MSAANPPASVASTPVSPEDRDEHRRDPDERSGEHSRERSEHDITPNSTGNPIK